MKAFIAFAMIFAAVFLTWRTVVWDLQRRRDKKNK
jgi:hypothetical protein